MRKPEESEKPSYSISNDENSPQKLLFERLSNKWFLMLLSELYTEPKRFNQLLREHARLSQKMLSQTLKNLEEDGLVDRVVNGNRMPVQVTYKITQFGISLIDIVSPLFKWSNENVHNVQGNRKKYVRKYSTNE